jgi:hypothetical protein
MSAETQLAVRVTLFWVSVDQAGPDECWPWVGYSDADGYGQFFFEGRMRPAHELALTFTTGERRGTGLDTCHSCNNPPCCNPAHLRFDTRASNVADSISAGTHKAGPGKLTPDVVRIIRERRANGARQQDLADQYGVTNGMVSQIVRGLRWPSAPGPIQNERTTSHGE